MRTIRALAAPALEGQSTRGDRSLTTYLTGGREGAQDSAHDFGGQARGIGLQLVHGLRLIVLQSGLGLLYLFMGAITGFVHGSGASLIRFLAAGFLSLEYFLAGFAESLFVISGTGFSCRNIDARLFHSSLGAATALGEHCAQRAMDDEHINNIKECQENDGRYGSEQ